MKKVNEMKCSGYYMIESLACARSCYFENNKEVIRFKSLFKRYMSNYVEIHKMYLSSEGYQILISLKATNKIKQKYVINCKRKEKAIKSEYIEEPWRIISEQMRIFGSVYAKWVNKERDRSGGLVKERYNRYYFDSKAEFSEFVLEMDKGKEVKSQRNVRYEVGLKWISGVNWLIVRGVGFVESLMSSTFQNYVVGNLVELTLLLHSKSP